MFLRTKNRKGISTVLTTLIILVASVVLGTGVVLYGTSMFQNQASSAALSIQGGQIFVNSTDANNVSWGAIDLRNSGDKIMSVDKILVRGQQIPYSNWYADTNATRMTTANFQAILTYTSTTTAGQLKDSTVWGPVVNCPTGTNVKIDLDGAGTNPGLCLTQQTGPLTLKPGAMGIVYYRITNSILTPVDSGSSADVGFYAGQVGAPTTIVVQAK